MSCAEFALRFMTVIGRGNVMSLIKYLVIVSLFSFTPMDESPCQAKVTEKPDGSWEVSCFGGCASGVICVKESLQATSGFKWTSCLCGGEWSAQNCSSALREGNGTSGDVYCLRGNCPSGTECSKVETSAPDGSTITTCTCM